MSLAVETTSMPIVARYLTGEDLRIAASILYNAYHDDPLFEAIFDAKTADYEKRLRAVIREELHTFFESNMPIIGVFEQERMLAVACIITPDAHFGADRFWHWRLKMMLSTGYLSTKQLIEKEQLIRDNIPFDSYHFLALIAVSKGQQRRGVGAYLLHAIETLVREDDLSEGVGVYVTQHSHSQFFKQFGFEEGQLLSLHEVQGQVLFWHNPKFQAS